MILAAATLVLGFTPERNVAAGDNKVKILNFETDDKNAAAPPRPRVHVYDMPLSVSFEYDEARPRLKPFESYTGGYRQYRTEALIPELVRASAHYEPDPDKADLFLVPFRGLARFYKHRGEPGGLEKVDAEYVAAVQWLEAQPGGFFRSRPADHMWIFGSGRGASIFPSWREHIADCIFIGPEGDERTGQVAPHDKDVIVPGYFAAAPPAVQSAALKSQAVRPILAHFRGSYTSARPGEEDFSEGVRLALMRATTAFRLPRHVMARKLSSGVGAYKASPFVVSNASIDPESYAREMQNADFCLCPMGSSSWTLRIYQAIASGCIPVLLSDHISLPFDYTDSPVDWRKIAIKWPQRDVTGLLAHLCSWSEADIAATRARVLNTAPMLLWNGPDSGALAQTMRYLTTDRPSHRPSRAASAWWGRGGEPVAPPVDALPMALPPPAQPTVPLDVLVMVKEMGCVTDQSVSALRNHVRPHTIHIVADRCEGGGSGGGSVKVDTCTETRNVMPEFPLEMAKQLMAALHPEVPAERTEWLYQQLLKFKSVLSLGLGTSVLVWDGDTVLTRPFPLPLLDERGTALLLQGTRYDSPAYFNKSGALPVGYAESTRKLLGVSPPWDTSFVVQWQVWERALVKEMTRLIESRSHEPWYLAMLRSVSDASTGLSEYTLYGTYATQWHAERIRVASSSEVLWLRDHPLELLDGDGTCCPSQERLRDIATGGFVYVSWECSHKSELRLLPELWDRAGTGPLARRRLLENSAPPSAAPYAPPSAAPYAPPSAAPYAPPSAAPYAPPSASPSPPPAYAPPSPPSASPSPPPLPPLVPGLVPVETTSFTISFDESVRRLLRALQQTVTFTISFEKIKTAVVDTIAAESVTDITTDQITVEPVDGNPKVLKVTIYPKEGQTASQILDAISSDPNTLLQNIGEELGENVPTPSFVVNPSIVTVGVAPPPPPPPAKKRGWVVAVAVCVPLGVALLALGVYLLVKKGKLSVPGYGSDRPSMTKHTVTEGV